MTVLGKRIQLPIVPGVIPLEDSTSLDTIFFTDSNKVRFQNGKLRKIRGWQRIFGENPQRITGAARNIFSYRDKYGDPVTLIGTNTRLYAYDPELGEYFWNITPLSTTTTVIANAFSTEYNTGSTILSTLEGSSVVTLDIPNYLNLGDQITISGITGTHGGIPSASLNGTFSVNVVSNVQVKYNTGFVATATGIFSIPMTWSTGYLYVSYVSHGLSVGDRIGILLASNVDGILAADINGETIVTDIVNANTFIIQTGIIATSSVTAGGGASTTIQNPIPGGNESESLGYGYGGGLYGEGLYGVPKDFNITNQVIYPRIWSMDKFGNPPVVVLTTGDGSSSTPNVYSWANDVATAPTLLTQAPDSVRWLYVSNNSICTLGSQGVLNQFYTSDVASATNWTPGPSTYAYQTTFEQSGPLLSQASCRNRDLIFTLNEVYLVEFIDKPNIWFIRKLFTTDGILGPKARSEIEDSVFWIGQGDFYVFDGYTVNILPNNTVKRYVFDNINYAQSYKSFCFANVEYNEIWFFYPAGQDIECNNYVVYNYKEAHWAIGTLSRSAAEEPTNLTDNPVLAQSNVNLVTPIPNALNTYFFTLENNPLTTSNGSAILGIEAEIDCYLEVGDRIFISGADDTHGILAANINGERTIVNAAYDLGYGSGLYGDGLYGVMDILASFSVTAGSTATSTGSGGGSSITIGTAIIGVTTPAEIFFTGDIITIAGAHALDGFSLAATNTTAPIRFIAGNTLQIQTATANAFSTSFVTGGGGVGGFISYNIGDYLFEHEVGYDDYNYNYNPYTDPNTNDQFAPMNAYAQTNYAQIGDGDNTMVIYSVYPDVKQLGNLTLKINTKLYAQSPIIVSANPSFQGTYTLKPTTTKVDVMAVGRQRQYIIRSFELGGDFLIGKWYEEVRDSSTR